VTSADIVQVDNARVLHGRATPAASEEVQAQATVSLKPIVVTTSVVETSRKRPLKRQIHWKPYKPKMSSLTLPRLLQFGCSARDIKEEHVVQTGETLYGIAKIYTLRLWICEMEQFKSAGRHPARSGAEIKRSTIAVAEPVTATKNIEIVHVVKSTDTLYSVAGNTTSRSRS
jgi:hypothetical protein